MQISTAYTHTHRAQHEELLQISDCCALIRNNSLSLVNHNLLVEAWNEKRNHTFLFEETHYHIWFQFLVLQEKSNNQPWQTLHLEPATSFVGALSPPPKSHPLGSQGKMALQNSEPTKWAKWHSVWAQKVVVLDCQFLNPVSKWRPSLIAEDDEITFTFEGLGFEENWIWYLKINEWCGHWLTSWWSGLLSSTTLQDKKFWDNNYNCPQKLCLGFMV